MDQTLTIQQEILDSSQSLDKLQWIAQSTKDMPSSSLQTFEAFSVSAHQHKTAHPDLTTDGEGAHAQDKSATETHVSDQFLPAPSEGVGVILTDSRQMITHVNEAFTAITGWSAGDAIGRDCSFLQGHQTNQLTVQAIRDSLERNELCRVAILNYRKSGEPFWNLLTIAPLLDRAGKVTNYVGIQMVQRSFAAAASVSASYVDRPLSPFASASARHARARIHAHTQKRLTNGHTHAHTNGHAHAHTRKRPSRLAKADAVGASDSATSLSSLASSAGSDSVSDALTNTRAHTHATAVSSEVPDQPLCNSTTIIITPLRRATAGASTHASTGASAHASVSDYDSAGSASASPPLSASASGSGSDLSDDDTHTKQQIAQPQPHTHAHPHEADPHVRARETCSPCPVLARAAAQRSVSESHSLSQSRSASVSPSPSASVASVSAEATHTDTDSAHTALTHSHSHLLISDAVSPGSRSPGSLFAAAQHRGTQRDTHTHTHSSLPRAASSHAIALSSVPAHPLAVSPSVSVSVSQTDAHTESKTATTTATATTTTTTKPLISSTVSFVAETLLPTQAGKYRVLAFRDTSKSEGLQDIMVMAWGEIEGQADVPLRVHDQCFTSEVFGSLKCDCKEQLEFAKHYIQHNESGRGLIIYLPQEGRGIGLANKIKAYSIQELGFDTVDANRELGFVDDAREYSAVSTILHMLDIKSVRLMTNNPRKIDELQRIGVRVVGRVPIVVQHNEHSIGYIHAKQTRMGHIFH